MFLTRCPRVIPVLWTIINTFVEERTREKFAILKTDELTEYIDEINIPDFLGGQMSVCCLIFLKPTDAPGEMSLSVFLRYFFNIEAIRVILLFLNIPRFKIYKMLYFSY